MRVYDDPMTREQYDPGKQLHHLGVKNPVSLLDIGCGMDGLLVHHLRSLGFKAEGMDPVLHVNTDFLMRRDGTIPRSDNSYDMAVSHVSHFVFGTTAMKRNVEKVVSLMGLNYEPIYQDWEPDLRGTLLEMLRVVRPSGNVVIWPEPSLFLERQREFLVNKGVRVEREPLRALPPFAQDAEEHSDYRFRAVLRKK